MTTPLVPTPAHGARLLLHVVPRASQTRLCGVHDGLLKVQVAAPPTDGLANAELLRFFNKLLKAHGAQAALAAGQSSKRKCLEISGIPPGALPTLRAQLGIP
jgi:uncharacterized protein (TIGR00251 family)